LEIARSRLGARAAKVRFELVDLWRWRPTRTWDSAVACFFLEHVPDQVLPGLLVTLHDALVPGAPFFVAEAAARDPEPEIETRNIDGRAYDVVERRRCPSEFETAFANAGFSIETVSSGHLVHLTATRN
jgi:cyclopropane fatty-acyl-phospholipid synthase-like methyltransferase